MAVVARFEDDLHEVLSSWIAYKETIPKRWKGDVKPVCVIFNYRDS